MLLREPADDHGSRVGTAECCKNQKELLEEALNVSEGTAYRAIKDAETKGYVSTIERVGTIRIEQKKKENIEKLTYAEVVNIIDKGTTSMPRREMNPSAP